MWEGDEEQVFQSAETPQCSRADWQAPRKGFLTIEVSATVLRKDEPDLVFSRKRSVFS
jgi:hypothetical protein